MSPERITWNCQSPISRATAPTKLSLTAITAMPPTIQSAPRVVGFIFA